MHDIIGNAFLFNKSYVSISHAYVNLQILLWILLWAYVRGVGVGVGGGGGVQTQK